MHRCCAPTAVSRELFQILIVPHLKFEPERKIQHEEHHHHYRLFEWVWRNEVLINPTYRENARKLQKAIAEAHGLSVAADLIEESLGARKKVTAAAAA